MGWALPTYWLFNSSDQSQPFAITVIYYRKNKGKKNKNKKGNNGKGSWNMNKNGQITNKKPKEKVEEEKELVIDIHLEKRIYIYCSMIYCFKYRNFISFVLDNGSTKNSNFDQNFKYETRKFIDSVKRPEENKKRIIKENSSNYIKFIY